MAAAALLRSVARKLARPPPPHPLARGLRDGARSGAGSLPPPTSNQVARAPPQGYRRLLHERGLHSSTSTNPGASGSTPPLTSDKELIEILRIRLNFAKGLAGAAGTAVVYLYFWALPEAEAQAYSRGKLTNAIQRIQSEFQDLEIMQSSGTHSGQGGTRVDKSEVDQVFKALPVMVKETADSIKNIEPNVNAAEDSIEARQAAAIAALNSALSERERKE